MMAVDKSAVAQAILSAGVVGFAFDSPRTFKSGILSPVYLDNRRLLTHPPAWRLVIDAMAATLTGLGIAAPVVAGIETAGIPHSSALAFEMGLPTVFVRKQAKEHGLQRRVEGGEVQGREAVLVEDMVTTGGSSLSAVHALRDEGASVEHCLTITSYGFAGAKEAFAAVGVTLHVLVTFADLLPEIRAAGQLSAENLSSLERWLADPLAWSA